MYKSIHDPVTGMVYPTKSNLGKQTVERYLSQLTGGSWFGRILGGPRRDDVDDWVAEDDLEAEAEVAAAEEQRIEGVRRPRREARALHEAATETEKDVLEGVTNIPFMLKGFGLRLPDLLKLRCESNKNLHVDETDVNDFVNKITKSLSVYTTNSVKELTPEPAAKTENLSPKKDADGGGTPDSDDNDSSGKKSEDAAGGVPPKSATKAGVEVAAEEGVPPKPATKAGVEVPAVGVVAEETGPFPRNTSAQSKLDNLNTNLNDILYKLKSLGSRDDAIMEDTYFNQNIEEWTISHSDQRGVMYLHHNFMSIWDPTSVSYPKRWLSDISGQWCKIRPIQEVVEKYLEALSLPGDEKETPLGYYELLDTLYKNELKWWGLEKDDIEDNADRRLVKRGVFDGWISQLLLSTSAQTTFTKVTDSVGTALSNFSPVSSQKPLVQWKYMGDMHQPYSIENDFDESGGSVKLTHDSTTKSIYDEFTNYTPYTTKGIKRFHERIKVANNTKNLLLDTTDVWVSRMKKLGMTNDSLLNSASVKGIPGKAAPASGSLTPRLDTMKKLFKKGEFIDKNKFKKWANIDPFIVGDIVNHPLLGNGIVVRTEASKLFDIKVWDDLRKMRLAKAIYEHRKPIIDTDNADKPPPGFDETNAVKKYTHEKRKFSVVDNVRNIHTLSFYEWESKHKNKNLLQTVPEITNHPLTPTERDEGLDKFARLLRRKGATSHAADRAQAAAQLEELRDASRAPKDEFDNWAAAGSSTPPSDSLTAAGKIRKAIRGARNNYAPSSKDSFAVVQSNKSRYEGMRPAQFGAINVYRSTFPNYQSSPQRLPARIRTFHSPPPNIFDVPKASTLKGEWAVGGDPIIVKFKTGLIALSTRAFNVDDGPLLARPGSTGWNKYEIPWRELCQRESLLSKVKLVHRHSIKEVSCENMKAWSTAVPKTLDIEIERPATVELGKEVLGFNSTKALDTEGKTAILNMATSLEQWCMSWTDAVSEMFWWIQNTINPTTINAGCCNDFGGDYEGKRIFDGLLKTECDIAKIVLKCKHIIRYVRTLAFKYDDPQPLERKLVYEKIKLTPLLARTHLDHPTKNLLGYDIKVNNLLILQSPSNDRFQISDDHELFTKFYPKEDFTVEEVD